MEKKIDYRLFHKALRDHFKPTKNFYNKVEEFIKECDIPQKDKSSTKKRIFDALAILEKEKIGGVHLLLERISQNKNFLNALKAEMNNTTKNAMDKASASLAFSRIKTIMADESFLRDWKNLKKKWGFLFVPDVFYPKRISKKNLISWKDEFVKFYLRSGLDGIRKLFRDISNFLAGYDIDCVYDGYPIIYSYLACKAEIDVDEHGRAIKVFTFPLRITRKELMRQLDDFNRDLEAQLYGEDLILKKIGIFYRYSWGMKPPHKKVRKKILHGYDWTEIFSYRERNRIIQERFKELKDSGLSNNKCYELLAKQFKRSPITIRQIIKKRIKFY